MNTRRVAGLVLAGGQARRMGGVDKALLEVGGRSMIASVIAALDLPVMAISANGDPSRFAAFGLPVLPDGEFVNQGPLAGLLAGLEWAAGLGADTLMTAPCDMPLLPHGITSLLLPAPCSVASGCHLHHLVATWPVSCASEIREMLGARGSRSVGHFAKRIGMRYVELEAVVLGTFINVNTSSDLARAAGGGSPYTNRH